MDPDLNKYDLDHRVSHHPGMSDTEWEDAYRAAWEAYYTPEHIRTILRRVAANPLGLVNSTLSTILWFKLMIKFEGVHPLEGGALRMKFRRDRRHGMAIEKPLPFYARHLKDLAVKACGYWTVYWRCKKILWEVKRAPDRWSYTDLAISPPPENEFEVLDLYHATTGGEAALMRKRRDDAIRGVAYPAAVRASG